MAYMRSKRVLWLLPTVSQIRALKVTEYDLHHDHVQRKYQSFDLTLKVTSSSEWLICNRGALSNKSLLTGLWFASKIDAVQFHLRQQKFGTKELLNIRKH